MSSLKRREELTVPSWPAESITTGIASLFAVVAPLMPAAKKDVCEGGSVPEVPIRTVFESALKPWLPM
jgi:hypothetical protein